MPDEDDTSHTTEVSSHSSPPVRQNIPETSPSDPPSPQSDTSDWLEDAQGDPSDIPRLRTKHSTAGYREGISSGRYESSQTTQAAFDQGWALGAALGQRVGFVLAALEALKSRSSGREEEDTVKEKAMEMEKEKEIETAREELDVLALLKRMQAVGVLGKGVTEAQLAGAGGGVLETEGGRDKWTDDLEELLELMPLVKKWMDEVEAQGTRAGVDLRYLRTEDGKEEGES